MNTGPPQLSQKWALTRDPAGYCSGAFQVSVGQDQAPLGLLVFQLQNGAICHHPAAFAPSLPTLEPAQWISILNSNEHLLKEKELLIDK